MDTIVYLSRVCKECGVSFAAPECPYCLPGYEYLRDAYRTEGAAVCRAMANFWTRMAEIAEKEGRP